MKLKDFDNLKVGDPVICIKGNREAVVVMKCEVYVKVEYPGNPYNLEYKYRRQLKLSPQQ